MPCAVSNCDQKVYSNVQWGPDLPQQEADLCKKHIKELYKVVGPQLSHSGSRLFWIQRQQLSL